ncbi:hypothetical protein ACOZGD_16810 [Streptomyces murinus]
MEHVQPQPPDPTEERDWIDRLILLHERPLPGEMSEQQNAGEKCMWCSAGDPAELRPLNGMLPVWPLRACPACIEARGVKVKTFAVWAEHLADCAACQLGDHCPAAMPLAEAHAAAVETATGSKLVNLICCKVQEDVSTPAVAPVTWIGSDSAYHSYVHVPKCRSPRRTKGVVRVVPKYAVPDDGATRNGEDRR